MRIEAYNAVAQVYQANKPTAKGSVGKANPTAKDEVHISSFGKDFQIAKQAVANASDVREDKVAEMKSKYSGDYQVDTGDFAETLLAKYKGIL